MPVYRCKCKYWIWDDLFGVWWNKNDSHRMESGYCGVCGGRLTLNGKTVEYYHEDSGTYEYYMEGQNNET